MPILGIIASKYVAPPANYTFWGTKDSALFASSDGISWDFKQSDSLTVTKTLTTIGYGPVYALNNKLYYIMREPNQSMNVSTNGTTWNYVNTNSGYFNYAQNILYANSKYLAIISDGLLLGTSTDAVTWTYSTMPAYGWGPQAITYGNGTYVVGGGSGSVYTSTDGTTWTSRTSSLLSTDSIVCLTYGDKFVGVGYNSNATQPRIITSTDGVTWTSRTSDTGWSFLQAVTYDSNAGRYVASGRSATLNKVAQYSTDGITWTNSTTSTGTTYTIQQDCITANNGTFVAIAHSTGSQSQYFWTSTDGDTWTSRTNPDASYPLLYRADYFDSKWYVPFDDTATNPYILMNTTNFTTWTYVTGGPNQVGLNFNTYQDRFSYVNGNYVILDGNINSSNVTSVGSSTDLVTWTFNNLPNGQVYRTIFFGNGTYVIGGGSANLYTSTNLSTWTSRTSNFAGTLINSGAYGASAYVICGNSGKIASSTDAVTWTTRTSNFSTTQIQVVRYLNNQFIAAGGSGKISTSTDGTTWTSRTSGTANFLIGLAYGASTYVCVGDANTIIKSTDGVTWSTVSNPAGISDVDCNWGSVSFNGTDFLVSGQYTGSALIGKGALYLTSTDGTTWTSRRIDKIGYQSSFITNKI